jgi:integrase
MATLVARQRKDRTNGYRVQWRLHGGDGPWQSETFDDRRAAAKFQAQVEACGHQWPDGWVKGVGYAVITTDETATDQLPLATFSAEYVRRLTSTGPDTQTRYLRQVALLVGWLTDVKGGLPTVENVTSDDDRDWINARRRAGASPKTTANYHGLLSAIFKSAISKGLVGRNPCEGVKLPPVDDDTESDDDKTFLTESEFALLHRCMNVMDQDFLLVAVGTGLRWGELTALKVRDVDLDGDPATLTIRRAWKRNGSGEFALAGADRYYLGKPKTKESRRRITLSALVSDAVRRATVGRGPDDLVFGALRGGRLDQGNWYESRWQRAIKAARKEGLTKTPRFHDLRHTHAAWLISAGVPLPVIQKRLGHKSIQITVDVYGGLLFQTHEVADLAMDRALDGKQIVTDTRRGSGQAAEVLAAQQPA